jgi:hypothetical protein
MGGTGKTLPPIGAEPLYALLYNGVTVGDNAVEVRFLPTPDRALLNTGVMRL